MTQEERKLKRMRKKRKKWFFIILITILILFRSVLSLFASTFKTTLPEQYEIEEKISTEAIILRRETLYKSEGEGKVEIYVKHGERIAAGTKIGKITFIDDTSTLKQQLEEVENKIQALTQTELDIERIKEDESQLNEDIDNIVDGMQEAIAAEDYEVAGNLKDKLFMYYDKKKHVVRDNTLINQSLENLKKKREEIQLQISNNSIDYFSKEAGIVSFKLDGYEEIYPIDQKYDYGYSDFGNILDKGRMVSNNDIVKANEPIFKIIDNFEWYMIIKVDNIKDIFEYKEGNIILLAGEEIKDELKGVIEKITKNGTKGLILVRFNRDFEYYVEKRHLHVDIIKNKQDVYRIPSKTIVEKDGIKWVYVKDISGIVKLVPVEIIKEDEEYVYISQGDKNSNINIKGKDKAVRTVRQFDEILLNIDNIKEGMIID